GYSSGSACRARKPGRVTHRAVQPRRPRSKNGLGAKLATVAAAHPGEHLTIIMSIYVGHDGAEDLASALGYPTHHVDEERHAEDHDYGAWCSGLGWR
ncbi:MAG TPA: hypothetical protein VHL31_23425, partial [Geminicoccus sp.]